jgi:hypothetical protein
MKKIEIDDEVFAYLQSKAIPFVDSPNLTLRRLFKLNGTSAKTDIVNSKKLQVPISRELRKKRPKANLPSLVQAGLLDEGQVLYLHDYQGNQIGNQIRGYEAKVSGKSLLWNNKIVSMSELASQCLKSEGFSSSSVRGPAHWYNADSISVKELWNQFLNRKT